MGQAFCGGLFGRYLETADAERATSWQLSQLQRLDLSGGSGDPMEVYAAIRRELSGAERDCDFVRNTDDKQKKAQK
jgi:hypothetical protein